MIIGGLGLVVWMHLWSQEVISAYPVQPDNDVTGEQRGRGRQGLGSESAAIVWTNWSTTTSATSRR
jgi:hypothetical protein